MSQERLFIDCECDEVSHCIRLSRDNGDDTWEPSLTLDTQLATKPFFKRVWLGLKYIFQGYPSNSYYYWSDTMITRGNSTKLIEFVQQYQKDYDEWKNK